MERVPSSDFKVSNQQQVSVQNSPNRDVNEEKEKISELAAAKALD